MPIDNSDISIITPTLNAGKYIRKCLSTVSSQEGVVVEHIVIDGGSIDDTVSIATELGARVYVLKGSSIYEALNYGSSLAESKYIGFLNGDDYYHSPFALRKVLDSFALLNDVDIVYGNCRFVDSSGQKLYRLIPSRNLKISSARICYFNVSHPTWFILKDTFFKYEKYDVSLRFVADCDFILRALSRSAKFLYVDFDLATFVLHGSNMSSSNDAQVEKRRSFVSWNGESTILTLLHYLFMTIMYSRDVGYFKFRVKRMMKRTFSSS